MTKEQAFKEWLQDQEWPDGDESFYAGWEAALKYIENTTVKKVCRFCNDPNCNGHFPKSKDLC